MSRFLLVLLGLAVAFFLVVVVVVYVTGRASRRDDAVSWATLDDLFPRTQPVEEPVPLVPPFGSTWRPWLHVDARVLHHEYGLGVVVTAAVGALWIGVRFDRGFSQWCRPVDLDPAPADVVETVRRAEARGAIRYHEPAIRLHEPAIRLGNAHCCVCAQFCTHIGPIRLCAIHQPGSAAGS